ncbi:hypothetical protein K0M31_013014 [Melipona bicolor]|uniref:Uncharacterized protein n=1 Tax=Melipona bicolor TaxID=60889 RepID=A0AA40FI83_9HYME|nr:hypothetical protein K0M31_013014 [Melipona bicolor]
MQHGVGGPSGIRRRWETMIQTGGEKLAEEGRGEEHKRSGETENTGTHRCREVTYFIKRSSYPRQADRGWRRGGGGNEGNCEKGG